MLSNEQILSPRFLWLGIWTALQGAAINASWVVLLNLLYVAMMPDTSRPDSNLGLIVAWLAGLLLGAIVAFLIGVLLSAIPAAVGGAFLAARLRRLWSTEQLAPWRPLGLGTVTGAIGGTTLAACLLIPAYLILKSAHNGIGFDPIRDLAVHFAIAFEIVIGASIAGSWAERRLRDRLSAARSKVAA